MIDSSSVRSSRGISMLLLLHVGPIKVKQIQLQDTRRHLAAGTPNTAGPVQLERYALPDGPGRFGRVDGLLRGISRAALPADPGLFRQAEMAGCRWCDGVRNQRQRALPAEHGDG